MQNFRVTNDTLLNDGRQLASEDASMREAEYAGMARFARLRQFAALEISKIDAGPTGCKAESIQLPPASNRVLGKRVVSRGFAGDVTVPSDYRRNPISGGRYASV